jgi:hypothetical protein
MREEHSRHELLAGVRRRSEEIGQAVRARVDGIGERSSAADPEYLEGLRGAIRAAIDDTIDAADRADIVPVPLPVLSQARLAARDGVPLETVLRRYLAGHAVLGDLVVEEAERQDVAAGVLRWVLRAQAARTDQVLEVISADYLQEAGAVAFRPPDRRLAEQVQRLLDGELLDPSGLGYDLDRWHLAVHVRGPDPSREFLASDVAREHNARPLVVEMADELLCIWLGSTERLESEDVEGTLSRHAFPGARIALGEPASGDAGWRLTHNQARAALSVAVRLPGTTHRYKDVALLATAMRDELLTTSLSRFYLEPLEEDDETGRALRTTLRTYLRSDLNVTSTAAALGISRNTVRNRLRAIEEKVGYLDISRVPDLLLALRLSDLTPGLRQMAQP